MLVVTLFTKVMLRRRFGAFVPHTLVKHVTFLYKLLCSVLNAFGICECRRPSRIPFVAPTLRGKGRKVGSKDQHLIDGFYACFYTRQIGIGVNYL